MCNLNFSYQQMGKKNTQYYILSLARLQYIHVICNLYYEIDWKV